MSNSVILSCPPSMKLRKPPPYLRNFFTRCLLRGFSHPLLPSSRHSFAVCSPAVGGDPRTTTAPPSPGLTSGAPRHLILPQIAEGFFLGRPQSSAHAACARPSPSARAAPGPGDSTAGQAWKRFIVWANIIWEMGLLQATVEKSFLCIRTDRITKKQGICNPFWTQIATLVTEYLGSILSPDTAI